MKPHTRKQRGGNNNFLHEVIQDKNLAICSVKEKKSSVEKLGRFHRNAGVTWLALRWDLNTVVLCAAVPHVPTSFMESELPLISLSVVLIPMPARCFSQGQGLGISRR